MEDHGFSGGELTGYTKNKKEESIKDIDGKELKLGHIVAVRYSWNCYIGSVSLNGLRSTGAMRFAFFSPHSIKNTYTYQILGHIKDNDPDFNQEVFDWFRSEEGDCPIKIRVYDNVLI